MEKVKSAIGGVYAQQRQKLTEKQQAERRELEDSFNQKWSSQYPSGNAEERFEAARRAKDEEQQAFQTLQERHVREMGELEEAHNWVLNKFVPDRYRNHFERMLEQDPASMEKL